MKRREKKIRLERMEAGKGSGEAVTIIDDTSRLQQTQEARCLRLHHEMIREAAAHFFIRSERPKR